MRLYEEFKLYENMWDDTIVEAGNNYTLPAKRIQKTTCRPPLEQYFNDMFFNYMPHIKQYFISFTILI
jgi:hypothetical protein